MHPCLKLNAHLVKEAHGIITSEINNYEIKNMEQFQKDFRKNFFKIWDILYFFASKMWSQM